MKYFVKIIEKKKDTDSFDYIQGFDSQHEFLMLWENAIGNFGDYLTESLNYTEASPEEIEAYLLPYKQAVIEADKKKVEAKKILEDCKTANEALATVAGLGYFFQDNEGTVYKTNVPEGRFVYYERVEIQRTRRDGETKGSLSMKEAREAGFVVEGK